MAGDPAIVENEETGEGLTVAVVEERAPLRLSSAPDSAPQPITRAIAGEAPVSITYNGLAHAVMMATPADLEDFAVGFTLAQKIVERADEVLGLELRDLPLGILAQIRIGEAHFQALAKRRRNLVGQTGCGLCGIIELEQALLPLNAIEAPPCISRKAIFTAMQEIQPLQPLHRATGAMHAAAFCGADGAPAIVREDVGRHNAFDKLTGAMARHGVDAASGFAFLTSRCSYELVEKAVLARLPALVTISAPTGLALARAEAAKLTLICLARPDSALIFNDPFGVFAKA